MQTYRNHRPDKARRGMAIVYLVALFDIASAMAPASAALHSDPPTGLRQCFRMFFNGKDTKKLATPLPVVDRRFCTAEGGSRVYFGNE